MRAFLLLLALLLLFAFLGWISFSKGPGQSSVNIETEQIRTDANKAMQSGAELLQKTGEKLQEGIAPQQQEAPQKEQVPPVQHEATPVR